MPKRYLKIKLTKEGSEAYEKIVRLKMEAPDGKMREADVADTLYVLTAGKAHLANNLADIESLGYARGLNSNSI